MKSAIWVLMSFAIALRAQPSLNTTSLASGLSQGSTTIQVANGALIVPGEQLYVDGEAMLVTRVSGLTVTVVRGASGSTVTAHAGGATVFLGPTAQLVTAVATAPEGANLVTDGTFASGCAHWTCGPGWTASGGRATHSAGSAGTLSQMVTIPSAGLYEIRWTMAGGTSGTLTFAIGASAPVTWSWAQSDLELDVVAIIAVGTGTQVFSISPSTTWSGTLTNVSITAVGSVSGPTLSVDNPDGSSGLQLVSGGAGLANTYVGYASGLRNTTGYGNTSLGYGALSYDTAGALNTAVGYDALVANTTGTSNVAIGYNTLVGNTNGSENVAVGIRALFANVNGYDNTAVGIEAMQDNVSGYANTAAGLAALLTNSIGAANIAIGAQSLYANKTGNDNVALGSGAGRLNTSGLANVAVGGSALYSSSVVCCNVAVGNQSMQQTTGAQNTAVGHISLRMTQTGANNTALGYGAGVGNTTANANVSGSNNTFVGYQSGPAAPAQHNFMTILGAAATGNCNNCVVLGRPGDGAIKSRRVLAENASYAVNALDSNTFFTNTGASGPVNFILPVPVVGLAYTFYVDAPSSVQITASPGATIQLGGVSSAMSGNVTSATSGNAVQMVAISPGSWVAKSSVGAWLVN